jgi:hypothetical protein
LRQPSSGWAVRVMWPIPRSTSMWMALHFVLICVWLKTFSPLWSHGHFGCDGVSDSLYFLGVVAPSLLAAWVAALWGLVFVAARTSWPLRRQRLNGWSLIVFAWVVVPAVAFALSHADLARYCSGGSGSG